jgi:phosphoglycolate phosphatase
VTALVTFDLDGTLVDSRRDLAESASEMLASYGGRPISADEVAGMVGEGAGVLVRRALEAAGLDPATPDALERFLAIYERRLLVHTHPYDGVPALLRRLSDRAALGVLTNKPDRHSRRLLKALKLDDCFKWVVGADSPYGRKPDPGGLRHLMEVSGAGPGRAMHVGDSMVDVETARRAGAAICLAAYGYGFARGDLDSSAADLVAADVTDLGRKLEAWLGRQDPHGSPG